MSVNTDSLKSSIFGSHSYSFKRAQWVGLLFVLPVVLGTLILNIIPTFATFAISFTHYDLLTAPEWAGLDNYRELLKDQFARDALRNTAVYTGGMVVLGILAGLGLALLVNTPLLGIRLIRLVYIIPVVSSTIAVALVWQWILNGKLGLLNQFLKMLGLQGQSWLTDPNIAMFSVIIVSVWQSVGYNDAAFSGWIAEAFRKRYMRRRKLTAAVAVPILAYYLADAIPDHVFCSHHYAYRLVPGVQYHLHLYSFYRGTGKAASAGCLGILFVAKRLFLLQDGLCRRNGFCSVLGDRRHHVHSMARFKILGFLRGIE